MLELLIWAVIKLGFFHMGTCNHQGLDVKCRRFVLHMSAKLSGKEGVIFFLVRGQERAGVVLFCGSAEGMRRNWLLSRRLKYLPTVISDKNDK